MFESTFFAPIHLTGLLTAAICLYFIGRCTYLLFFHPLAKFPGPWVAAMTDLWWGRMFVSGRGAHIMLKTHRKYGDVVRIAPNELSFATPQAYQDIYGHVSKGRGRFLKTEFYDTGPPRINTARDPEVHARQRKALSHAFSSKALRDQEVIVHQYADLFLRQLSKLGDAGRRAIDVSEAYNWLTFDIIGDLAFGESFNAVAEGKTHFWIAMIFDGIANLMVTQVGKRIYLVRLFERYLLPKDSAQKLQTHIELSREKARKRIELGGDGRRGLEDFFGHMIRKGTINQAELQAQSRILIVAGSETTAATLTATTYHLLRNTDCLTKLQDEIRGAFTSLDQITGDSTARLEYLHGAIEEGLRLFPPVAIGLPRYSPGAIIDGHYIPAGVVVSSSGYEMSRDSRYWHNPETFLPERWIGQGFNDDKKASQPFSTGPRGCLGINLAYLELRIILAKVIFEYDLELVSEQLKEWNQECELHAIWKRPQVLVKAVPRGQSKG